jgi:predicted transcriptional regulator
VDKEGVTTMLNASQTKPDDALSKAKVVLTYPEIARRLGISEEAARALIKAASLERREKCANRL